MSTWHEKRAGAALYRWVGEQAALRDVNGGRAVVSVELEPRAFYSLVFYLRGRLPEGLHLPFAPPLSLYGVQVKCSGDP